MFSRAHIIVAFVCFGMGLGFATQVVRADSTNLGQEFLSLFRSNKSQAVQKGTTGASSAASYHRLARTYAEQNDTERAKTNFSLALQNAAPQQVVSIAADYAAFLTDNGDLRNAELMLKQALNQSPNDAELVKMLARCLVRQDRIVEGRRYFLSVGTEAEAGAEIAAIYRQQGNTEMLVAVEQKWGAARPDAAKPTTVRPEQGNTDMLAAAEQKREVARPDAARPATVRPEAMQPVPVLIAATPRPATSPSLSGSVRALPQPPTPAVLTPRAAVAPREVTVIAAAPVTIPVSKSEFFDNRVPIPVPRVVSLPVVIAADSPRPAQELSALAHVVTQPTPVQPAPERLVLTNPVRLAAAPSPGTFETEAKEPPRPAKVVQPRRHYVVNAGTSADLEAILPIIRPVAAAIAR